MYECPGNYYSSYRSFLRLNRRRLRILPRHCLDSILELDRLHGPLLETPNVGNDLLAVVDVHSEQPIISLIRDYTIWTHPST
jgi:hypothetical protein